ncbi:MAG: hypothetical protein ACK5LO_08700 [Leucobacter sp.]
MSLVVMFQAYEGQQAELSRRLRNGVPTLRGFGGSAVLDLPQPRPDIPPIYGGMERNSDEEIDALFTVEQVDRGPSDILDYLKSSVGDIARFHGYQAQEDEVFRRDTLHRGSPSDGYKLIRGLYYHDDLSREAARRSWKHHRALAERVHIGLGRYSCILFDGPLTQAAPNLGGLSVLHFPDAKSMEHRYFDSPRGREEILHDTRHFQSHGTNRLWGQEYLL